MKVLLVVGLAAVIIVILIAVFLSMRLSRGDDREDQPARSGDRGRSRRDAEDARWRDRDSRDPRRPRPASARSARSSGPRSHAEMEPGRYRDDRRADRDQGIRSREYDRSPRYDTGPGAASASRRPVAAAAPRAGLSRDSTSRRSDGAGRDRYDSRQALYDTGPTSRPSADDFPSGPFPAAADYPSDVFPSGPLPVADFPSGPLPAADYPSAEYPAADYPSGGFPSGPLPVADFPSGDLPAARPRSRASSKADTDAGRPDSRRKQPRSQNPPKGRSRQQRGKRDDDDEWPSMEWDKLSDEQYWAELSSDKPLSVAQPVADPKPAPAKNGQSRSGAAKPKPAASQPAPAASTSSAAGRDQAARKAPAPQRDPVPAREPATERLPVRARQQASPSASRPAAAAAGGSRRPPAPLPPAQEPTIAMLASLGGTPPPARPQDRLDDDPLTSPSFAVPAADSRSYSSARKSMPPGDTGPQPVSGGQHSGSGYGYPGLDTPSHMTASGPHPAPTFADAGYSYQAPPRAEDWPGDASQHTPAHGTRVQGNPYGSYVDETPSAYRSAPPAGYADTYPGGGYQGYSSHAEPAGYPEPAYEQAASDPYQGYPAAPAQPADPGHYLLEHNGYPGDGGYPPEEAALAGYPEGYGHPGYAPGYPAGYTADPYGQEGYGGYSAAQG